MQWLGVSSSSLFATLFLCLRLVYYSKAQCSLPDLGPGYVLTPDSSSKDTFLNGSSAAVQCGEGHYKNGGNETIVCKNGSWTTATLECKKRSCGSPGELINGAFNISQGTEFGATAFAKCNRGFEIVGVSYRQCFAFGWSNLLPICDTVKCPDPPEVAHGTISSRSSKEFVEYRDVIEYTCDKNFNLVGKAQIVCNEHGQYEEPPKCKETNCPAPNISNSVRTEGGPPPYKLHNFVNYECRQGFVMNGISKLVCEVDGWSSTFPTCIRVVMPVTSTTRTTTSATVRTSTTTKKSGIDEEIEEIEIPSTPSPPPHKNKTSIVVGCIAAVVVVAAIIYGLYHRSKKKGEYRTGEDARKNDEAMILSSQNQFKSNAS
ncbi:hypothetical protein AAFF_G00243250 [Aldrovandia affinis]|uniref:Sushi domain-containing protein n=1 Tax=Aldrovandia affinis TaxID=143900 RepID=A0AAD7W4A9_9TELE|nr:hypothetical protein AAFF_G00243250 [Aldrovandia affinis]